MAISFPLSPSTNDEYTFSGITWKWNGYAWNKISGTGTGGSGATWTRQDDAFPETLGGIEAGTTLANGTVQGQIKIIVNDTDGGTSELTPQSRIY